MKLRLILGGFAALVVGAVLFPAVLYVAIGVLAAWLVAVIVIVKSGLSGEGERKTIEEEVQRRAEGIALRRALIRREAAHLAAVEEAKDDLQAER